MSSSSHYRPSSATLGGKITSLLGVVVLLFGLFFLFFGAKLALIGGSLYYVLCGIPLTLSGLLIMRGHRTGVWLYVLAWAATIPWTLYEVGFDWWGWLPRLFGPTLIMGLLLLCIPVLKRQGR